jgi:hypothetical protein
LTAIGGDSNGTGYMVEGALVAVYSHGNSATSNGEIIPDRTIHNAATQLEGPYRIFLLE